MLLSLSVKNLALVDRAEVEFKEGLNIITGETGAGKSIIIGSINLALGGKVSKDIIRSGAEYALVELVFEIDNDYQRQQLEKMDIFPEDNQLIISRKITPGRSISKINGETVTVSNLKEVAGIVIDIHGQHEHQSLLNKHKHFEILDEFAKNELCKPKAEMAKLYRKYSALKSKLDSLDFDESSREREISFLQYEIEEIQNASLSVGEDELLEAKYKKMENSQKITDSLSLVHSMLDGSDSVCAGMLIGNSVREMAAVASLDDKLKSMNEQLLSVEDILSDFNRELSDYISEFEFDEEEYHEITQRLDLINHLKSKYGNTIEQILKECADKQQKCDELINFAQNVTELKEEIKQCELDMTEISQVLTEIRKKYAGRLSEEIKNALLDMNFLDVQFDIMFNRNRTFSAAGIDDVEFVISTNPGEPLLPLGKVASGGELSRIMLAIKTVLAKKDFVDTMIFDEIDVGISGRTAQKISEKMGMLAKDKQIICITHLPQIAAMSDCHFLIEKNMENNGEVMTKTTIRELSEEEIYTELARLLGGVEITKTVMDNAKEMRRLTKR